ncbi:MAG TPA: tetratricopeptide repeat protein, partial [Methylomirabilota bacterium]|nr:tetratricopeptide repeat protein [Methylomirabilota bacterium]
MDELIRLLQRADLARKEGRHGEAEALAREVIARDPSRAAAHTALGAALTQLRRSAEAEAAFRAAV